MANISFEMLLFIKLDYLLKFKKTTKISIYSC